MALCDKNCNVIAPFVAAPSNCNESVMFIGSLKSLKDTIKAIGASITGSILSLDGIYNCRSNRKAIFNSLWVWCKIGFFKFGTQKIAKLAMSSISEILLVTLAGIMCGAEGWSDIEKFGIQTTSQKSSERDIYPF